jgi:hypothetical protein
MRVFVYTPIKTKRRKKKKRRMGGNAVHVDLIWDDGEREKEEWKRKKKA